MASVVSDRRWVWAEPVCDTHEPIIHPTNDLYNSRFACSPHWASSLRHARLAMTTDGQAQLEEDFRRDVFRREETTSRGSGIPSPVLVCEAVKAAVRRRSANIVTRRRRSRR